MHGTGSAPTPQFGYPTSTETTETQVRPLTAFRAYVSRYAPVAVAFAVLLLLAVYLQIAGNAYASELSGFPDEPAHFITGLMIRDYIASGAPTLPMEFAEQYYLHYPKVAFGMWGPLLHVLEAGWMLVVPPSRAAVLVLMAMISAALAALLFRTLRAEYSAFPAAAASAIFLCIPTVQSYTGMVMADGLVALMDFAAALAFARFLTTASVKHSVWFGVFACLSILSKGNGVALVLLPALAVLFARRFDLLRIPALWAGPSLIVLIAGPWQYYSARMLSGILERKPGWAFVPFYALGVVSLAGVFVFVLAVIGFYRRIVQPWKDSRVQPVWASAAALLFAVLVFHCLIPAAAPEMRYLIAIAPPLLMFATAGATWICAFLMRSERSVMVSAALLLPLVFFTTAFHIPQKKWLGFDEVAAALVKPEHRNRVILVSSEADGEGMLIAEMAVRELRPGHIILRATKMLSRSDWNGARYQLLHESTADLINYLRNIPVQIVVVDTNKGVSFPHHDLLKKAIAENPKDWELLAKFPSSGPGERRIEVYRLLGVSSNPRSIRIDLPFTLGRPVQGAPGK